jgi:hypothetical protein
MRYLKETLAQYVSAEGHMGKNGPSKSRIANREALTTQLRVDMADARRILMFWGSMIALAFAFLLVAASLRLAEPYVTVPVGCSGLFLLLRRVESVWRELRLQSVALQMALVTDDEKVLREVMTTLNAALLAEVSQKRSAPQPAASPSPSE